MTSAVLVCSSRGRNMCNNNKTWLEVVMNWASHGATYQSLDDDIQTPNK